MFGISSGVDDDEDVSDNSSIPMSYQHFNPAVRPRSKLGRRRLMQPKETKNVDGAHKQETQPRTTSSHWQKDDSGIFPSDSTPSLTHPVSRGGNANFNAKLIGGTFTSTFTPSFKSNQENIFNKFALPSTPRFRSEPLKEINDVDNLAHQPGNQDNPVKTPFSDLKPRNNLVKPPSTDLEPRDSPMKTPLSDHKSIQDSQEVAIQKQLNSSFISNVSIPPSSSANKTANETSDFSNDSSFMTCHMHVQQPNKTVYDPAFLKTPGRNLAEIRIDESPFDPLENFLEESDDFGSGKTPLSSRSENESKLKVEGQNEFMNVDESRYSDPLAFPLECSNSGGNKVGANSPSNPPSSPIHNIPLGACDVKHDSPEMGMLDSESGRDRAYSGGQMSSADSEFKHPSLAVLKTPHKTGFDQKEDLHTTPSSGYVSEKSFQTEETTHVTYPQPSKSALGQKNTFTSQFSLNSYKPGISNSAKVLSLASQGYEPVSAASLRNVHGILSSHFEQGYGSQSGRMVHRMGNVRDSSAGIDRPLLPGCGESVHVKGSSGVQSYELDSTVNSISSERTVVARNTREPGPGGGPNLEREDTNTVTSTVSVGKDATVVARESLQAHHQVEQGRSHTPGQEQQNEQQSCQIQKNGLHTFGRQQQQQQQQQSRLPVGHHLPNRTQFGCQQLSGPHSVGLRDHSRHQFGGQHNKPQPNVYQDPHSHHQQTRPQSAGQLPLDTPNGADQQQQTRPKSAAQPQSESVDVNPVLSALMKPQPQNVITIKGTSYTVLSLLGKGGSSQVYQALGPQSSKLMAIKCVNLASVEEAMATDYLNEIALLSKLQGCPSVIKMFDHEYIEQSQMLYVVLEKGDIDFSKLIKNISENNQISMPMILYYWSEMLNAVHEIHKRGIIHSDLKPANFLLVEGRLKLIDFGIASSIQGDTTSVMKDVPAGTYNYMSPESITGPKITRKSDVWSMGCILFNLLYGRTPFSHLNNRWQKLHAIADVNHPVTFPPLKHHAPPSLRLALRWCLNKDPALRPTVEELVTLSELSPPADSGLGKEIDGMMCQYFRRVLPNLRNLKEDSWERPSK